MSKVFGTFGGNFNEQSSVKLFEANDDGRKIFIGPKSELGTISLPPIPRNELTYATPLLLNLLFKEERIADARDFGFLIDASTNRTGATLIGGNLGDVIRGGTRHDVLKGGAGDDVLEGGAGSDALDGGTGSDTASYANAAAAVRADLVTPEVNSGDARGDTYASIENLRGTRFADRLLGDNGDNVLEGGAGADILEGRGGSDTASYEHSSAGVSVSLAVSGPQVSAGDASGDVLQRIENLRGSDFSDTLVGDRSANVLDGRGGADTLVGGAGDDTYFLDRSDELVFENAGEGFDSVFVARSFTLGEGQEIELLRARGANDVTLTGNAFGQAIYGNVGNDTIRGGGGADNLIGGEGSDTFVFAAVSDSTRAARDTLRDFVSGVDRIDLSQIVTGAEDGRFQLDLSATGFSREAGELIVTRGPTSTQIQGDVDGNGTADLFIVVGGNTALQASDFILA